MNVIIVTVLFSTFSNFYANSSSIECTFKQFSLEQAHLFVFHTSPQELFVIYFWRETGKYPSVQYFTFMNKATKLKISFACFITQDQLRNIGKQIIMTQLTEPVFIFFFWQRSYLSFNQRHRVFLDKTVCLKSLNNER